MEKVTSLDQYKALKKDLVIACPECGDMYFSAVFHSDGFFHLNCCSCNVILKEAIKLNDENVKA